MLKIQPIENGIETTEQLTSRQFSMKLSIITEGSDLVLFKGVSSQSGLENWPEQRVGHTGKHTPGFLTSIELARTYAEPELTGSEAGMVTQFHIDEELVEDRTKEYMEWWDNVYEKQNRTSAQAILKDLFAPNKYDISCGYPQEWRNGAIWTVRNSGSAHGDAKVGSSCFDYTSFVFWQVSYFAASQCPTKSLRFTTTRTNGWLSSAKAAPAGQVSTAHDASNIA
jgi:hypothetical protein